MITKLLAWFFTPTEPFTHRCSFWGIPGYFNVGTSELGGTNIVYDWLILNVVPWCFAIVERIRGAMIPGYETEGWPILLKEPLSKP